MAILWALAMGALIALVHRGGRYLEVAEALDVELPGLTKLMIPAAKGLHAPYGLWMAIGGLGLTLLPFTFGLRSHALAKAYLLGSVLALLAVAAAWLGLIAPFDKLAGQLAPPLPR